MATVQESRSCQCENQAHFTDKKSERLKTPNGNYGHKYLTKFTAWYLRTWGQSWTVCKDCFEDCCVGVTPW